MAERDGGDPSTARRIAENEARFRATNERIEESASRWGAQDEMSLPFVCECGRPDCIEILRLSIAEYELARADNRYFVCSPGHEITHGGIGRVVQERPKFVIVEKLGIAGATAEELDPRAAQEETEQTG